MPPPGPRPRPPPPPGRPAKPPPRVLHRVRRRDAGSRRRHRRDDRGRRDAAGTARHRDDRHRRDDPGHRDARRERPDAGRRDAAPAGAGCCPGSGSGAGPCPARSRTGCCPGAGRPGRWPMPCALENGLLPGRGAPPGAAPGRGARRSGCVAAGCAGAAGAAGAAAAGSRSRGCRVPRGSGCRSGSREPEPGRRGGGRRRGRSRRRRARSARTCGAGRAAPLGAARRSRSGSRGRRGLACAVCLEGSAQLASDGGLDGRRGALDELAELLELRKSDLAVDTEFGCDLVYAWFGSHNSPVWVGPPRQGRPQSRTGLISSRSLCFHSRSAVSRRSACPEGLTHAMPARRRGAGSRPPRIRASRCTHAPLPGIDARSSGTRVESTATTRRSEDRGARARHPTHVRTGSMLHLWAGRPPRRRASLSSPGRCRAGCRSSRR